MDSCHQTAIFFVIFLSLVNVAHLQDTEKDTAPKYLTKDEYYNLLESDSRFLVNFVSPGCVKCSEFAPEYEEVAKHFATTKSSMDIKVFIEGDLMVIRKLGLRRLPSLFYVREKTPLLYTGDLDAESVISWVEVTGKRIHRVLNDENFEHLTQATSGATTGDWLILFCNVQDPECTILLPMWESIAYRLHSLVNVAVVDTPNSPQLIKRFKLSGYPSMQLFRRGKRHLYTLQQRDDVAILGFARNGYKQLNGIDIEPAASPFDTLTENIADQIKEVIPAAHASKVFIAVPVAVVVLLLLLCVCRGRRRESSPARTKKGV